MQGVLLPSYVLHKDAKDAVSYTVPQGTEIEVYRKVRHLSTRHDTITVHKVMVLYRPCHWCNLQLLQWSINTPLV